MIGQLVKISTVFNICYGHQLDLNKQVISKNHGISFVNRTANNLGISCKIERIPNIQPFRKELITVSLGGSILESYVQPEDFYTGQNIKVLEPKIKLSYNQMLFYCLCIKKNAYKYSAFGREANKTFNDLLVPNVLDIPKWVEDIRLPKEPSKKPFHQKPHIEQITLEDRTWVYFTLSDFFKLERGKEIINNLEDGTELLISASEKNNGLNKLIKSGNKLFNKSITIANNGSVGASFYQDSNFYATSDVTVLNKKNINKYIGLFVSTIITKERYRFSYGRKWSNEKMKITKIKLPSTSQNTPDWEFMESYIKSLPYSSSL
jgi:hypothetical protein